MTTSVTALAARAILGFSEIGVHECAVHLTTTCWGAFHGGARKTRRYFPDSVDWSRPG
jgi:hypothetical protein